MEFNPFLLVQLFGLELDLRAIYSKRFTFSALRLETYSRYMMLIGFMQGVLLSFHMYLFVVQCVFFYFIFLHYLRLIKSAVYFSSPPKLIAVRLPDINNFGGRQKDCRITNSRRSIVPPACDPIALSPE